MIPASAFCLYVTADEAGTAGLARKAHPWQITPDQFFTARKSVRSDWFPLSRVDLGREPELQPLRAQAGSAQSASSPHSTKNAKLQIAQATALGPGVRGNLPRGE